MDDLEGVMQRLNAAVFITAEPHWAWRIVNDPRRHPEWQPDLIEVTHVKGVGVGANADWTRSRLGVHFHGHAEVLESEEDRRVVEHDTGAVEAWWTFTFKPEGDGTWLEVQVDYKMAFGVLESALWNKGRHDLEAALDKLRALAEHEARA